MMNCDVVYDAEKFQQSRMDKNLMATAVANLERGFGLITKDGVGVGMGFKVRGLVANEDVVFVVYEAASHSRSTEVAFYKLCAENSSRKILLAS